jgi:hypothetical protein
MTRNRKTRGGDLRGDACKEGIALIGRVRYMNDKSCCYDICFGDDEIGRGGMDGGGRAWRLRMNSDGSNPQTRHGRACFF